MIKYQRQTGTLQNLNLEWWANQYFKVKQEQIIWNEHKSDIALANFQQRHTKNEEVRGREILNDVIKLLRYKAESFESYQFKT